MEYPILVNEVWKSYGTVQAVRGLNLNVPPQSVYGFLGPNGAGKSTTIRLVLGLQRPDRGDVYLFGRLLAREPLAPGSSDLIIDGVKIEAASDFDANRTSAFVIQIRNDGNAVVQIATSSIDPHALGSEQRRSV
jgi:ABC-type cobalamin/Fe3+-siderophores transport system ATPase subunit